MPKVTVNKAFNWAYGFRGLASMMTKRSMNGWELTSQTTSSGQRDTQRMTTPNDSPLPLRSQLLIFSKAYQITTVMSISSRGEIGEIGLLKLEELFL